MIDFQSGNSIGNYTCNIVIYDPCEYGLHFHKNYELIYVIEGQLQVFSSGKEFYVNEGEFSLILPNSIHSLHTPKNVKVWVAVFSADFISGFDNFVSGKENNTLVFRVDELLMPYLKKYLITTKKSDLLNMRSMFYAVCWAYLKSADFCPKSKDSDLAAEIFEYVKNNFKEDISLKTMATALGYNYHYMSRIYNGIFHINFNEFLNRFRLEHAHSLLIQTKLPITEIAMLSGFGCVRTMNRYFLKEYNEVPQKIRKSASK